MELLLIRHAQPFAETSETAVDPGLTPRGVDQAALLASALGDGVYGPVTSIVSSTMRRARATAEPCARALGLELAVDEGLVELDHGFTTYGGGFSGFATRAEAWDAINDGFWDGHEFDAAAFVRRAVTAVEAAVEGAVGERVAVVCHGGVISAYLGRVLRAGRPLFFSPDYTGVCRVLVGPGDYREMMSANERRHLPARR